MTIETKIAKNGVKLYYVDGKRTSREVALQAAADNRENLFTIEYATRHNAYFTNGENQVYESTSKAVLKELELKIDEYHGFTVQLHTIGWVEICKLFNKDYAKSLINKIENAFIRGEYGVKIDKYGKVSILPAPVIEPNPNLYAVNPDAFDIAVNAEIQNANNVKINDLKWEIRYTEGSINDLDQNHIAHAPNDQSLQERRTELQSELAALNSQLADLLPAEIQNANNEIHSCFYKQDDNGNLIQISYEQAQAEADEALAKFCGLSPEQYNEINNEESQVEPDTTHQIDPIIQERETARNEYDQLNAVRKVIENDVERFERLRDRCKAGSPKRKEYNQLLESFDPIIRAFGDKFIAAQDRYNKSLTLRTDEERAATQKAIDEHNADLDARGIKYFATVYYYPNGIEGEDMETFHKECTSLNEANAFVSQEDHDGVYVGGIYDAGWQITDRNHNLIADHTTGIKEENAMTNRDKFLKVAKVIKCEENINNAKCWYYNTLADIDTEHWKRISKARANEILFCYGLTAESFLAEQKLIDEETRKLYSEKFALKKIVHPRTIKAQADFYADKVKRESKPLDNENVFDLLPDLDNDVEKVWLTKGELDDLTAKFRAAVSIIPVTTRIEKMLPVTITITKQNSAKPFEIGFGAFAKYSIVQWITGLRIMRNFSTLGRYDTPAQVEKVIDLLKMAITRGDKAFTFPTVEELDPNPDDELIDEDDDCDEAIDLFPDDDDLEEVIRHLSTGRQTLNHKQKKNLRDSLERAKQIACKNIRVARRNHNKKAEDYERELYDICNQALKEVA